MNGLKIEVGGRVWVADPNANWAGIFKVNENISGGGGHIEFYAVPEEPDTGLVHAHIAGFTNKPAEFDYGIGKTRAAAITHARLICEHRHSVTLTAFDDLAIQ